MPSGDLLYYFLTFPHYSLLISLRRPRGRAKADLHHQLSNSFLLANYEHYRYNRIRLHMRVAHIRYDMS